MSDVMLYGVLNMPYELAMSDEMSRYQFYDRVQQLLEKDRQQQAEIEALKRQVGGLKISLGNTELLLDESFDRNTSHMAGEYISHQKPTAWIGWREECQAYDLNVSGFGEPLYTHPAKTLTDKPHPKCDEACMYLCKMRELTDEEIWELADMVLENSDVIGFARAILRKAQE